MGFFNKIVDNMVSEKVPRKRRKRLIVFVALITLLSMTTATVAWFTVNTFAGVDNLDIKISMSAQLKVGMENYGTDLAKYTKVITNEMIREIQAICKKTTQENRRRSRDIINSLRRILKW